MADETTQEKKTPSQVAADFMKANGYKLDLAATQEAQQTFQQPGVERKIYVNGSGKFACVEAGKDYVALSPVAKKMTTSLQIGTGGRVGDAGSKTADELTQRLTLIANDKGIPLTAATSVKREKAAI